MSTRTVTNKEELKKESCVLCETRLRSGERVKINGTESLSDYIRFNDESGDSYPLTVWKSIRAVHKVCYNSDAPALIRINWSNKYISE